MNYFQGAVHELKNVTWPTEKEVIRLTKITLVFLVLFTLLFFFTDSILSGIFSSFYASI
ncbi:TPA: preprotein translocase subunit SecE [Candidatus Gracilibacteria bacterium]|nr:preprotein translocase subunit SecE [Candidatus Gracilibacteria bacterium]